MSSADELSLCPIGLRYPWWCGFDLDYQIERHVDNPHIANAKKGSKIPPICGINSGETLPR